MAEEKKSESKQLKEKLFALKEKYPCISDVRGIGLMVAIEFSHEDGSPAPDIWAKVKKGCLPSVFLQHNMESVVMSSGKPSRFLPRKN